MKEPISQWDDPVVQLIYKVLTDDDDVPPPGNQHWEGWMARRIADVIEGRAPPPGYRKEETTPAKPVLTRIK